MRLITNIILLLLLSTMVAGATISEETFLSYSENTIRSGIGLSYHSYYIAEEGIYFFFNFNSLSYTPGEPLIIEPGYRSVLLPENLINDCLSLFPVATCQSILVTSNTPTTYDGQVYYSVKYQILSLRESYVNYLLSLQSHIMADSWEQVATGITI